MEKENKASEKNQSAENEKKHQQQHKENEDNIIPQSENSEAENTEKELERLREECEDLADKNLRLLAEFDNYRKRMLKEKADLLKNGGENVLVNILPLVDDFERALKAIETSDDIEAVKEGIHLIYGKFVDFLNKNNVKEIPTENVEFNTQYHEAVSKIPAPSEELKGKVIECLSKGYTLNDKVIRYAKVVVGE
ncbi:MAG TPA: nucleotide exchange factor GrpE [Paludibacteraceae bacterium]|jgi:molecular chaperone GrpE|nr:nucleotide exchange factor GrpE [Paludibacteraceae bacterium]OPZ02774.1 MAG: heat shock protein GrpE [Bacteroidetes bacterium ADurb.BinA395]MBP8965938.1 nucleotide exchange factor GrpE [Paludibacteraceae bacterium]HOF98109.1 nucleotide exchange factor GrpE [Paludibacteraceae bacterium]HON02233.1 nucleotide exchange factor GrpE [Paludibacteraceae bacterium]